MANKKNKNRNRNRNNKSKNSNSNNNKKKDVAMVTYQSVTENGGYQIFVVNGNKLEANNKNDDNKDNRTFVFENTKSYVVFTQLSVSFF